LNYFNYFTEIEDIFVRRRGKHIFLSPLDWALIENWKERGVPLYIAIRGIEKTFDSHESRPRKRSVKTLFYCQEEVEAQYADWLSSQVGAGNAEGEKEATSERTQTDDSRLPFPREAILKHLSDAHEILKLIKEYRGNKDDFSETLERVAEQLKSLEEDFAKAKKPLAESLENSLTNLEKLLDEALLKNLSSDEIEKEQSEVERELKAYRSKMDSLVYEQTFNNLLLKRLRERSRIPRLSLFYL
jgi:hypothetical protein